jgi:hypothetical protein
MAIKKTPAPIIPSSDPNSKPYPEVRNAHYPEAMDTSAMDSASGISPIAQFTSAPKPVTNTDVTTSADMNKTDVGANNIPMPVGYWNGMSTAKMGSGLQSTGADKPTDYLTPEAREMMGYGKAGVAGYNAGANIQPTTDSNDAVAQVAGSTIAGAAGGLAAGGPWGAVVGGVAGLVSGGINAYVGTHSSRAQQRKQDKLRQEIAAKDEARYQQARADQEKYFNIQRSDTQENERYNRRMAAIQSTWQAQEAARRAMNDAISQDANAKQVLLGEMR